MKVSVHPQISIVTQKPSIYGLRFAASEQPEHIQLVWLTREELLQTSLVIQEALSKHE